MDASDVERDIEWVVGHLKQIQTGYPQVLQDVQQVGDSVKLSFYLEDISIDALQSLRTAGVDAWEDKQHLRHLFLALSSMTLENCGEEKLQAFRQFLERTAAGILASEEAFSEE